LFEEKALTFFKAEYSLYFEMQRRALFLLPQIC